MLWHHFECVADEEGNTVEHYYPASRSLRECWIDFVTQFKPLTVPVDAVIHTIR